MATTQKFSFALSRGAMVYAIALVAVAALILGASFIVVGPNSAQAGYLAIMFLLTPATSLPVRMRILAAAWAIFVATAGYLVGPYGLIAIIIGLILVSFAQAFFKFGEAASVNRSPVNFVAFATIGATGTAELWMVVLGSVIGAVFVLLLSLLLPAKKPKLTNQAQNPAAAAVAPVAPFRDRFEYGLILALGAVIIMLGSEWLGFAYAEWALLSYCMILSVGGSNRAHRARDRVFGTIAGALLGTFVSFLPEPFPLVVGIVATILCISYLRMGNYTLFVAFLTPAVLLTTSSEQSAIALGEGRIIAVLSSAALAILLSFLANWIGTRNFFRSLKPPAANEFSA